MTKPNDSRTRTGIFAFGVLIVYCGVVLLNHGIFVYRNYYRAEVYSPPLIVLGVIFIVLALIPDSLVGRLVKRGRG